MRPITLGLLPESYQILCKIQDSMSLLHLLHLLQLEPRIFYLVEIILRFVKRPSWVISVFPLATLGPGIQMRYTKI